MLDTLRLYGRYVGISVRGQMQYRGSFLLQTAGHLLLTGTEYLGLVALFARFGQIRGWSLAEVALLYGIISVAFALSEAAARGFDTFSQMVKSGDFDRLLLRPRSTALQVAGQELQLMRVGRLIQGVAVLAWAATTLDVAWSVPKMMLLVTAMLGGACFFSGVFILQGTLAFWTIESLELVNTVTYGGVETAQFPLTIYRPWFRQLFTWVIPLAFANYLPAHAILGRAGPDGLPTVLLWAAPAVGVLFLVFSLQVWKIGVRHYCSTGS